MGQQAGENYIQALAGFILTDAGIALLGMIAVVLVGTEVSDLGRTGQQKICSLLSVCIYLLIGPLFALNEQEVFHLSWRFVRIYQNQM